MIYGVCEVFLLKPGALSIQPKIPVISVGTSNGTDHFGLVRPEYSGPALKVVLFDRSGHFGRSDRNVPFFYKIAMATCRRSPFQDGDEVLKCHE